MTRLAYPLPDIAYPDNRRCVQIRIPDEPKHIQAFLGQVYALSKWFTWDRDQEKRGASVAIIWKEIFDELIDSIDDDICSNEESFPMLRQSPTSPCVMEYKDVNGVWIPFFDYSKCGLFTATPTLLEYTETNNANNTLIQELNIYGSDPNNYQPAIDVNAQSVSNRNKLLCYTLRIVISTYLEVCARDAENVERGTIGLGVVLGAIATVAFAPLSVPITALMLGSLTVGGIAGVLSVPASELRDMTAQDSVICHAYNHLKDDALSRPNVQATFNTVPFSETSTEYKMCAILGTLFNRLETYLVIANMMMERISGVDGLVNECDGCGNPDWSHTFNFTQDSEGWYVEVHTPPQNITSGFLSGGTWQPEDKQVGGRYRRAIQIARDFAETTITGIYVNTPFTKGIFDQNIASHAIYSQTGTNYTQSNRLIIQSSVATNDNDSMSWSGLASMRRIRIHMASSHRFTQSYSGNVQIESITITGRGINPFV